MKTEFVVPLISLAIVCATSCRSDCADIECGAEAVFVGDVQPSGNAVSVELCVNGTCSNSSVENGGCFPLGPEPQATACLTGGSAVSVEVFLRSAGQEAIDGDEYSLQITDPADGAELVSLMMPVTYEAVLPNGSSCPKTVCRSSIIEF